MTVREIYDYIDSIAQFSAAAQWDNSGLLIGSPDAIIEKIVVCLDVNDDVVDFAVRENAQLIISHHPVIFRPVRNFCDGSVAYKAALNKINIISAHTNLDKAVGGVNDTLCEKLGLGYKKVSDEICDGFLNIIDVEQGIISDDLASLIKKALGTIVTFCRTDRKITRIGVCCGSGADFVNDAAALGCNAFITGEASYHEFLDAKNSGICLFACGHFETEIHIVRKLKELVSAEFNTVSVLDYTEKNSIVTEI